MATRKTTTTLTSPTLITTAIEENLDSLLSAADTNDELQEKTNEINDETETMEMMELVVEEDDDDEDDSDTKDNKDNENIEANNEEPKDAEVVIENTQEENIEKEVVGKEIEKIEEKPEEKEPVPETDESVKPASEKLTLVAINVPAKKEGLANSEGEENSTNTGKLRPALIRGRKSIKELKDAIKEELNNKLKEFEENQELAIEKKLEQQQEESKRTNMALKLKTPSPVKEEKRLTEESKEDIKIKSKDKLEEEKESMSGDEATMSMLETTHSCRLTRKSAAQELVANTRITRNRQNSSGSLGRPETPPTNTPATTVSASTSMAARTRRSVNTRKTAGNVTETSPPSIVKRKRSIEENCSTNELITKHIKMEAKDDIEMDEEDARTQEMYNELAKIKQELSDGSESTMESIPIITSTRGRPRGRKSQTPTIGGAAAAAVSPSTRSTRHTKVTSQSPTFSTCSGGSCSELKRRRIATGNTMTRSSMSLLKSSQSKPMMAHAPDEDSKDSMDYAAAAVIIKGEKHGQESAAEEESACEEIESMTDIVLSANGVGEPLTVDTSTIAADGHEDAEICEAADQSELATSSNAGGSEKAASLSPDMLSEGVNVMSVKQYYKKAEFLENNLGIEEDPKLGEIVQKAVIPAIPIAIGTAIAHEAEQEEEEEEQQEATYAEHEEIEEETGTVSDAAADESEKLKTIENLAPKNAAVESLPNVVKKREKVEEEEEEDEGLCGRLVIQEDDEDEDNTTESANRDLQISEEEKVENIVETNNNNDNDNNKKTKNECDKFEAKLKSEIEVEDHGDDDDDVEVTEKNNVKKEEVNKVEAKNIIDQDFSPNDDDEVLSIFDNEMKRLEIKSALSKTGVAENKDNIVHAIEYDRTAEQSEDQNALVKCQDNESSNDNNCKAEAEILFSTSKESNDSSLKKSHMANVKDDDANSMKSGQSASTDTNSWAALDCEYDEETLRQKEKHLQNLGLLTHKAAEKRRQEYIQSSAAAVEAATQRSNNKRNGKAAIVSAAAVASIASATEYTGTLKTVIKLNRSATSSNGAVGSAGGRKSGTKESSVRRQPLKMTFQKGRGRGQGNADRSNDAQSNGEDAYYTIQNENEGGPKNSTCKNTHAEHNILNVHSHGRKSYKRSNNSTNHNNNNSNNNSQNISKVSSITTTNTTTTTTTSKGDSSHSEGHDAQNIVTATITASTIAATPTTTALNKKDEKEEILIPEKASSFKFHPGRLCEDQCYYCSGKFGLYDTPCHVGQIKSVERQQKILANEEKLTVDNCLCDACFRHVDRRANAPSYRKRLSAPSNVQGNNNTAANTANTSGNNNSSCSNTNESGQEESSKDAASTAAAAAVVVETPTHKCLVTDCTHPAVHSLRRKCIRKSVKKFLLNFEMPTGSACIWLCQTHYDTVIQCSGCVLCKRRLGKNHMYHITSDTDRLEKALSDMGIPVQLGIGTAVCKLCRYFANLLMKPPDSTKSQKAEFVKNYRKRLLEFHNIHEGSNEVSEVEEDESSLANKANNTNKKNKNTAAATAAATVAAVQQECEDTRSNSNEGPTAAEAEAHNAEIPKTTGVVARNVDETPMEEQSSSSSVQTENIKDFEAPLVSTDSNSSRSSPLVAEASIAVASNSKQQQQLHEKQKLQEQQSKLKAILQNSVGSGGGVGGGSGGYSSGSETDISNVLRSNPNISMRELFPGEEDLGLHFKAPFGSSNSQRTPEGWTRVQTFLQYDEPTRRLWEDLQKPYGNQSSFLRHLILLEKYFRNGDLVLAPQASSNASVYTQNVRQRLCSYDSGWHKSTPNATPTKECSPLKQKQQHKEKDKDIPTVEINDADEDGNDDVEMREEEGANDSARDLSLSSSAGVGGDARESSISILGKHLRSRNSSVDKLTKQLSSNAVTIIARPKDAANKQDRQARQDTAKSLLRKGIDTSPTSTNAANACNSRSILKSNLLGINNKSVEILPILSSSSSSTSTSISSTEHKTSHNVTDSRQHKILEVANKLLSNQMEQQQQQQQQQQKGQGILNSPPELVSLPRRSAAGSTNNNVSPIGNGSNNNHSSSSNNNSPQNSNNNNSNNATSGIMNIKRPQLMPAKTHTNRNIPPNVVILPEALTQQERLQSKCWRPTLLPVEENQHLLNKSGPLYQTADGRRLPALVQVQSGGKPFLISIFDYNRMCILRREKLMRDQMLKSNKNRMEAKQQQQQQQHSQSHHHTQQHQQSQQKQHSANSSCASGSGSSNTYNKQQQQTVAVNLNKQQQAAQQQLMQLSIMQLQKHQQQQQQQQQQQAAAAAAAAALKTRYAQAHPPMSSSAVTNKNTNANNVSNNNNNNNNFNTQWANAMAAGSRTGNNTNNNNNNNNNNSSSSNNSAAVSAVAAAAASLSNASWLWNNFSDANMLFMNGAQASKLPQLLQKANSATASSSTATSHVTPTSTITSKQQQHQMAIDNALMTKIPKSLTVIPQHKLMLGSAAAQSLNAHMSSGSGGGSGTTNRE